MDYLTRLDEAPPVKDCTVATAANVLFDNVVTRFGILMILISDKGTHVVNQFINELTKKFPVQHREMTPYHP